MSVTYYAVLIQNYNEIKNGVNLHTFNYVYR